MLKADSFEGGAGAWGPQPGGHRREQGVPEAPWNAWMLWKVALW